MDEDMMEQVLVQRQDQSDAFSCSASSVPNSPSHKVDLALGSGLAPGKWRRLGRNFSGAISALRNSFNLDSLREQITSSRSTCGTTTSDKFIWAGVVRNLTKLYPGSQLPEKLLNDVRHHFDSLPFSYAQAGHDMKDILLHARLIEQATADDYPAIHIQDVADFAGACQVLFLVTFVSVSPISWPSISAALDCSSISCKKIQIFEKKNLTLGIVTLLVYPGGEKHFKARVEAAVRSAVKKQRNAGVKLHLSLCGCQEENGGRCGGFRDVNAHELCESKLPDPLPCSSLVVSVDEWQTVRSGGDEIRRWLLGSDQVELVDRTGPNSFRAVFRGKKVWVKKLKGCDRGKAYEMEVRRDLLELMSCGHKNILQLHGICVDDSQGPCIVTGMMKGGSLHDLMKKSKRISSKDVVRIAVDVAEGLMFMNDHGVAYRDLNVQRILLDKHGNACLGDMGVAAVCRNAGEVIEYETSGFRWLAPEIIAGDPETVTETWMSNVYSFGMVIWEMVTGEAAYCSYSPVQAAVGIAACGLRPDIPKDCPQVLRLLMTKCWDSIPSKRPRFSEILSMLLKQNARW